MGVYIDNIKSVLFGIHGHLSLDLGLLICLVNRVRERDLIVLVTDG